MTSISIRYDDIVHRKLKIIAAYKDTSINSLMLSLFDRCIKEWESEHGPIQLPD